MKNTFYTLSLNPALDRTMYFQAFRAGELNRTVSPSYLSAGSKGINVSRFFYKAGERCPAFGFAGGQMGEVLKDMLCRDGIDFRFTQTVAETRQNIKLISSDGEGTEANEAGGPFTDGETHALLSRLLTQAEHDIQNGCRPHIFLCGSIPQGVEKDVYKSLVEKLRKTGAVCILDCDGVALEHGMQACPTLIKPNIYELSALCRCAIDTWEKAVEKSVEIYRKSGIAVLCTMGAQGAVYIGNEGCYRVDAPTVTVRGFSGAGDTFLAAFVLFYASGKEIKDCLAFASAAAAAKVEMPGSAMPDMKQVEAYKATRTVLKL